MPGMVDDKTFPVTRLTVQGPRHLEPHALSGPYPLLSLLRASALLRPALDDTSGAARVALSLRLLQSDGGQPMAEAAVLLARDTAGAPQAAQISDLHGQVCFSWSAATLADAVEPPLQLTIYVVEHGHVRGIAAVALRLQRPSAAEGARGLARHQFTLSTPI
jgi:hypothetical protein